MNGRWQNRLVRRVVEAVSWLAAVGGKPLRRQRTEQPPGLVRVVEVQAAGSTFYRRPFQAEFPPAPIDTPGNWPAVHLHRIADARVSGVCGSIFLPDGALVSVCPWVEQLADRRVRRPGGWRAQTLGGPVLHLLGRNHENHGHFIYEYLPRVLAAEPWLNRERPGWRIAIAGQFARWQRRYLELLGYGADRVVELWPGTTRVEELFFVPRLSGRSSMPDAALMAATVGRLQAAAAARWPALAEPPTPGCVAVISRDDAPNKRLLNEAELIAVLRRHFPEVNVILLSRLNFGAQLAAMSKAAVIVGAQGMGLTNMAFLRERWLVCLEAIMDPAEMSWEAAYCLNADHNQNRSLTLYGGTERVLPHRHFTYPAEKFDHEMQRLARHLGLAAIKA